MLERDNKTCGGFVRKAGWVSIQSKKKTEFELGCLKCDVKKNTGSIAHEYEEKLGECTPSKR